MQPDNQVPTGNNQPVVESQNNPPTPITPVDPPNTNTTPPAPVTGSVRSFAKFKNKKLLLIVLPILLLFVSSASAYFFYIVPNKPENLWAKALSNTAQAYDKVIEYADSQKDAKGSKIAGTFKIEGDAAGDGSFETKADQKNSDTKLDVGFSGQRINLNILTTIPEKSKYPDVYVKASGIKGLGSALGAGEMGAFLNELDGKWLFIDHTLFDQYASSLQGQEVTEVKTPTAAQIIDIAKAVGEVNREYLFSDNADKNPIKVAEKVGKETKEGRSVYHFKVSLDNEDMINYLGALKDKLKATALKDFSSEESINGYFDEAINDLRKNPIKSDEKLDVWVDTKTKMFRFIESTDQESPDSKLQIAIPYDGGSKYPLNLIFTDKEFSGSVNTRVDTEANKIEISFNFEGKEGSKFKVSGSATAEPSNEEVKITKPQGAMNLLEVLGLSGGGLGVMGSNTEGLSPQLPLIPLNIN